MKHKLLALLYAVLLLTAESVSGQTLCVGVVSPTADTDGFIDAASAKALVAKLQAVLARNGVAGDGSDFVIVPTVVIDGDEMVESGMVNMYKISGSLNLVLTQLSTGKSFGSAIIPIRGTGRRYKSAAVKSAVGSVRVNDPALVSFLDGAKKKVVDYYIANSASIIGKAQVATRQGNYEEALALLSSFPEGMPNEDQINKEIDRTFKTYLDVNCYAAIMQAKAALSQKNYDSANYILSGIDPRSSCYSEALDLIEEISEEIRAAEAQARNDMLRREAQNRADMIRRENNAVALRKASISAARDVAKAYYQRTYPNYTIVFR